MAEHKVFPCCASVPSVVLDSVFFSHIEDMLCQSHRFVDFSVKILLCQAKLFVYDLKSKCFH